MSKEPHSTAYQDKDKPFTSSLAKPGAYAESETLYPAVDAAPSLEPGSPVPPPPDPAIALSAARDDFKKVADQHAELGKTLARLRERLGLG